MLPELQDIQTKDAIIQEFKGLNQKDFSSDDEYIDMLNMTSDEYPYLSPRDSYKSRGYLTNPEIMVAGTCVFDDDIYTVQYQKVQGQVTGCYLYKNMEKVLINNNPVALDNNANDRQMVKFGAYVVIYPDNVMYNTQKNTITNMSYEQTFTSSNGSTLYLSDKEGVPFIFDLITRDSTYTPETDQNFSFIAAYAEQATNVREIDGMISLHLYLNYFYDYFCQFLPGRTQSYNGEQDRSLYQANICLDKERFLKLYKGTTYPCFVIEKSGNNHVVKRYEQQSNAWYPVETFLSWRINTSDYDKIRDKVKVGDFVKLDALDGSNAELDETSFNGKPEHWKLIEALRKGIKVENVIVDDTHDSVILVFANSQFDYIKVLQERGNRFVWKTTGGSGSVSARTELAIVYNILLFPGGTNTATLASKVTLSKSVPDMDYITVSANRIWGCSSDNHEIYACKQGDATSWYNFGGLASDSYAVTIASEGDFTGAITYNEMPYFFKENICYGIYGNKPSNYQVQQFKCRGVENGAYQTLCQKDGYVYYKSKLGVERFNGNNSALISENLDLKGYTGQCAEICEDKLFVNMLKGTTKCYVYDIKKGMWHKEKLPYNARKVLVNMGGNLYLIYDLISRTCIDKIYGHSAETATWLTTASEDIPEWYVVSGEFNANSMLNKYVERFLFELKLEEGAQVEISFSYNNSDEWEKVYKTKNHQQKKLIKVPIVPKRLERMRYKIAGKGMAKIYSILMTIEGGSENG